MGRCHGIRQEEMSKFLNGENHARLGAVGVRCVRRAGQGGVLQLKGLIKRKSISRLQLGRRLYQSRVRGRWTARRAQVQKWVGRRRGVTAGGAKGATRKRTESAGGANSGLLHAGRKKLRG